MEAWSKRVAQDYNSLQIFGCPAYYHVKEDKLDPRARKHVFIGFKKGVKGYKIQNLKDIKFFLSRDVTFDEALMMKPTDSQQVESKMTDKISQQVESDATSPSLDRSVSFEITLAVTQSGDHIADQDVDDDKDQEHVISDVHKSVAVGTLRRNLR